MGNEKVSHACSSVLHSFDFSFPIIPLFSFTSVVVAASAVLVPVVPASFTVSVVVSAASAFMLVVVVSATSAFMLAAAASVAVEAVQESLYFFVRGLARLYYMSLEVQRLAGQGVVKVNGNLVLVNVEHFCEKPVAVVVLQRYDGVLIYVFVVEVAVYAEYVPVKVYHVFLLVVAVCVVLLQGEVECCAGFESCYFLFKSIERYAVAADKLERLFVGSLFDKLAYTVVDSVKFVCHRKVFVKIIFHFAVFVCF